MMTRRELLLGAASVLALVALPTRRWEPTFFSPHDGDFVAFTITPHRPRRTPCRGWAFWGSVRELVAAYRPCRVKIELRNGTVVRRGRMEWEVA